MPQSWALAGATGWPEAALHSSVTRLRTWGAMGEGVRLGAGCPRRGSLSPLCKGSWEEVRCLAHSRAINKQLHVL